MITIPLDITFQYIQESGLIMVFTKILEKSGMFCALYVMQPVA
jgi:hypothetical protein